MTTMIACKEYLAADRLHIQKTNGGELATSFMTWIPFNIVKIKGRLGHE